MAAFEKISYQRHAGEFAGHVQGGSAESLARTWLRRDTVDYWRHERMYACVDPLLKTDTVATWLTVGDGRYGRDAWYLGQQGARVVASNLSDDLLKEGKAAGLIKEYARENAESLSFPDGSFDYVFCKESFHHFPRPMLALYEMIRVARKGVVLIEPNEAPVLGGVKFILKRILKRLLMLRGASVRAKLRTDDTSVFLPYGNSYEDSGNYVYSLSEREVEKVALGLNFPAVAFKGLNDWYLRGVEDETFHPSSKLLNEIQLKINQADRRANRGLSLGASILLVACIFKQSPSNSTTDELKKIGFRIINLPRNPYV